MPIAAIIGIIVSLITTFGPKAIEVYEEWQKGVGDNPTPEQWQALKDKIASHNPDTY